MASDLVEALVGEMRRVRDDVLPAYLEIGAAGKPAAAMMRASLDMAAAALAVQDAQQIIASLEDLRGFEL